jgi:antitoxin ParD1/3/4
MPTRNVVLTEHQNLFIEQLLATGRYQNASEVLREGLRLIERQEREDTARLIALREAAQIGLADMENGRHHAFANAEELDQHLAILAEQAIRSS